MSEGALHLRRGRVERIGQAHPQQVGGVDIDHQGGPARRPHPVGEGPQELGPSACAGVGGRPADGGAHRFVIHDPAYRAGPLQGGCQRRRRIDDGELQIGGPDAGIVPVAVVACAQPLQHRELGAPLHQVSGLERAVLQSVERLAPQRQDRGGLLVESVAALRGSTRRPAPVLVGGMSGGDLIEKSALDLQGADRAAVRQLAAHPQLGIVGEGVQCADRVGEGEALGQGARPLRVVLDQGQQRRHGPGAQQARDRQG